MPCSKNVENSASDRLGANALGREGAACPPKGEASWRGDRAGFAGPEVLFPYRSMLLLLVLSTFVLLGGKFFFNIRRQLKPRR